MDRRRNQMRRWMALFGLVGSSVLLVKQRGNRKGS
jgi:hypothetical protein